MNLSEQRRRALINAIQDQPRLVVADYAKLTDIPGQVINDFLLDDTEGSRLVANGLVAVQPNRFPRWALQPGTVRMLRVGIPVAKSELPRERKAVAVLKPSFVTGILAVDHFQAEADKALEIALSTRGKKREDALEVVATNRDFGLQYNKLNDEAKNLAVKLADSKSETIAALRSSPQYTSTSQALVKRRTNGVDHTTQ